MREHIKMGSALALLLIFYIIVITVVLKSDRKNSFEIIRNNDSYQSEIKEQTEEEQTEEQTTEEEEVKEIDLDWAVERYAGKEIARISTEEKLVALTFDAGANADGVDAILEILEANDIRGTFFLTGKFIERYPDKVLDIISSGGNIGNHSYSHPYFTELDMKEIEEEISKTEDTLSELDIEFQPFLRSPYGNRNESTLETISDAGYINIYWTVDSLGWKGTSGGMDKDSVRDKVLAKTAPGAIIMMHLGSNPTDNTHLDSEALPEIISELESDGYEFVTLSELLEAGR